MNAASVGPVEIWGRQRKMFRMKQIHTHLTDIELRHKPNNACIVTQNVPFRGGLSQVFPIALYMVAR